MVLRDKDPAFTYQYLTLPAKATGRIPGDLFVLDASGLPSSTNVLRGIEWGLQGRARSRRLVAARREPDAGEQSTYRPAMDCIEFSRIGTYFPDSKNFAAVYADSIADVVRVRQRNKNDGRDEVLIQIACGNQQTGRKHQEVRH